MNHNLPSSGCTGDEVEIIARIQWADSSLGFLRSNHSHDALEDV